MSKPAEKTPAPSPPPAPAPPASPAPAKQPINKKQVLADIVAFFSIINSYFFISITLHFNIFENQLGIRLDNYSTIILLLLCYTALILTFKGVAALIAFLKRAQGENELAKWLDGEVNYSLLTVLLIASLYIFDHVNFRVFSLDEFCHLALWLWIAEVSKIFGSLLGRATGISSFSYWGKSIAITLLIGGLLEPLGLGIFVLF